MTFGLVRRCARHNNGVEKWVMIFRKQSLASHGVHAEGEAHCCKITVSSSLIDHEKMC